jgi:hyperosmotically inducible protein
VEWACGSGRATEAAAAASTQAKGKKMKRTAILSCLLLLSWGWAGFAQSGSNPGTAAPAAGRPPAGAAPSGMEAMPESRTLLGGGNDAAQRITREVLHELILNPYYSVFDNLTFRVEGDSVILSGQVVNPAVKSDAESSVKRVEGVEHVVNNIEVLPPSPLDDRIRRQVYRKVFSASGLYRYAMGAIPSIHIIVKNGHVTLVGEVDNQMDKSLAGIQANTVSGVFSVDNQLRVRGSGNAVKK